MTETIVCGVAVITFLAGGVQFFVIKPTKMFSTLQISVIDLAKELTALNGNIAKLQECIEKFSKWVSNELRALDARVSVLEKHNEILESRIKELERRMNHAE